MAIYQVDARGIVVKVKYKNIDYYKSFGLEFIENYKTTDDPELRVQNRNLNVALLEMDLSKKK